MAEAGTPVLELGTIQTDGSLLVDSFPHPFTDFLVARSITLPSGVMGQATGQTAAGEGGHTHTDPQGGEITGGAHQHNVTVDVPVPAALAPLAAGDRVIVAWINGGTDVVVLDVVVSNG